ncbi:hypothetical protein [Siphonobacter sp. SORGH_AS_1065]|uniref:hypothetical protein n=1 Tax=Siphonobacter sp. SORGH_AS_1065 TaxID=3041795 RepID=UPI002782E4AE|nr:hypothetical protein [Siphonobacter sp. SORGH_AS_1065]MDQ1089295.1 hypothetical protein [Siphonobacter sp. SORGH_AS_1065]
MALIKGTTLVDECKVDNSDNPIIVSLFIGFGQPAFIEIKLGQVMIAEYNNRNDPPSTEIGTNKSVVGQKLRITVRVEDKNENSDESSVGLTIEGVPTTLNHKLIWQITPSGGTAQYLIDIFFGF